jgi:hypothetical protein
MEVKIGWHVCHFCCSGEHRGLDPYPNEEGDDMAAGMVWQCYAVETVW